MNYLFSSQEQIAEMQINNLFLNLNTPLHLTMCTVQKLLTKIPSEDFASRIRWERVTNALGFSRKVSPQVSFDAGPRDHGFKADGQFVVTRTDLSSTVTCRKKVCPCARALSSMPRFFMLPAQPRTWKASVISTQILK